MGERFDLPKGFPTGEQLETETVNAIKEHGGTATTTEIKDQLAFDGSGTVLRGKDADMPTYSLCKFQNGKVYNCDLNASYNIASRYYIRKILKSCPETDRLDILAKVPRCSKRSTCTLADLISLNAVLAA